MAACYHWKIKPISDQDYKKADKNVLLVLPTDDKAFSEEAKNDHFLGDINQNFANPAIGYNLHKRKHDSV